jgi:hypothetical protein
MTTTKAVPAKPAGSSVAPTTTGRKPWIKRTPVEVVLEQIGKQEERVAGLQKELDQEKSLLGKLQKARAALES